MLFDFSPLYIIRCSVVVDVEMTVAEDLYSLSSEEGWGEVCCLSFFKTDGHITGTESGGKGGRKVGGGEAGRVVYCAEAGIRNTRC